MTTPSKARERVINAKNVQFVWAVLFSSLPLIIAAWFLVDYMPAGLRFIPGFIAGFSINWHCRYWYKEYFK